MPRKKKIKLYSLTESMQMLDKLQKMAIDDGNINLALKAEEMKCKVASLQSTDEMEKNKDNLTKILVDFINDKQNSSNSSDICSINEEKI